MKEYWIYWIDKYNAQGYRSGVSHGLIDGERFTLCGLLDSNRMDVDGGYTNTEEGATIECKKCLNKIKNNENITLNTK